MFNTIIPDTTAGPYNDYGVTPYVPYKIKDLTIGPIALNDTSEGLNYKFWAAYAVGNDLFVEDIEQATSELILTELDGIDQVSLGFDQNSNDTYAYVTGTGELKLRFFDSTIEDDVIISIGQCSYPLLTMDMKYHPSNPRSDILLFYIRSSAIYYREQRDRYATEYATPVTSGAAILYDSGIRTDYRFQVRWM